MYIPTNLVLYILHLVTTFTGNAGLNSIQLIAQVICKVLDTLFKVTFQHFLLFFLSIQFTQGHIYKATASQISN